MVGAPHYDEFGLFHENAEEHGLKWDGPPIVRRAFVDVEHDRTLSALVWGAAPPEIVLIHGRAQNAHTWDTVALALDRPLVAIDLAGYGHSDPRPHGLFSPEDHANDVAIAVQDLAPNALAVVGMSFGGLTAIALTASAPQLVRSLVLVDVTPSVDREKAAPIGKILSGPESFESFEEILAQAVELNPTRSKASLRRGALHNAFERDDGRWVWRYQRPQALDGDGLDIPDDFRALWDVVDTIRVPIMLVRGGAFGTVLDHTDEEELLRRQPSARVELVKGAGHSIQGDRPLELAALLADLLD